MNDWIEVTERIALFSEFLTATWNIVQRFSALSELESFVSDWRQSSWEQLVEASLKDQQLGVYDGGADMYPSSSRVFRPDLMPTHIIVCTGLSSGACITDAMTGAEIAPVSDGFPIEELCMVGGGGAASAPPFDHVRVGDHITSYAFALKAVRLWVRPILPAEV